MHALPVAQTRPIHFPASPMQAYNWWSEATHGISHVSYTNQLPAASNTGLPITTSCAFNRSLWAATGNQIAREARAFMNAGLADSTYWAPVINIVRDPRWGRNIETAGEDPFLSGEYARNFVNGFEHATETPYPLQASACCKHFVANELDGWNGTDRDHFDAFVPQQVRGASLRLYVYHSQEPMFVPFKFALRRASRNEVCSRERTCYLIVALVC